MYISGFLVRISIHCFVLIAFNEYIYYSQLETAKLVRNELGVELLREDIKFPKVVEAQILLETDFLRSKIFNQTNNLFGMKHNSRQYSKGTKNGHAFYNNVFDSIKDYKEWQESRLPPSVRTDEDYLNFLDHLPNGLRYAEDKQYTEKLRSIMKHYLKHS